MRAAVQLKPGAMLRANYSANADIILDSKRQVLAIEERVVEFSRGKTYVEVEGAPQVFTRREVQLGLSDGIYVEVLSGIDESARLKVPSQDGTPDKKP